MAGGGGGSGGTAGGSGTAPNDGGSSQYSYPVECSCYHQWTPYQQATGRDGGSCGGGGGAGYWGGYVWPGNGADGGVSIEW